ncbi:App1 family protein [bacterium]|nr:App1 family protein [bacterium]
MSRPDYRVLRSKLRLTDLPYSRSWGGLFRFTKTLEVFLLKLLQILRIYRTRKSIIGIPSLATRNYTSLQAVVYNGTQEEVLGFRPRGLLSRVLRGVPNVEMFERLRFQLGVSEKSTRTVEASTELRGFVHLQLPWQLPWRPPAQASLKLFPRGVETSFGTVRLGDYDVHECPVFFVTEQVKWIIISDIDDTIKESDIATTTTFKAVVRSIFKGNYYTYKAIEGMADLYRELAAQGVLVVYLTSTPYQLAPFLLKFLRQAGFPEGPVYPRWLGNNRFGHKWRMLHRLLSNLDGQKVFLVGDSGEQDLQIYRRLCDTHTFGEKVEKILIRHVPGTPLPALADARENLYADPQSLKKQLEQSLAEY